VYAGTIAERPERGRVVAVAELRPALRERLVEAHGIGPDMAFADWRELLDRPPVADFAVIALQDADHVEAATALADHGYHLLLEKPMATTWEGCLAIADAVRRNGALLGVCHVMRYTPYTMALTEQLAAGAVGELVSIEHLEPVAYWHLAHSFVRGPWRNEAESTFMLLAKACHDLDWIADVVGAPAVRVASMGSLKHFRAENAPDGSAERCLDCAVEPTCPFSAVRFYRKALRDHVENPMWEPYVLHASAGDMSEAGVERGLREGPYGRCVYCTDNDVVDHQIVSLEFADQTTASFTMTIAAWMDSTINGRRTRIFGTEGQLDGDGRVITVRDYRTDGVRVIDTGAQGGGHGGGDQALTQAFVDALYEGRPELIQTSLENTLHSHRLVFAAEQSRRTGAVVAIDPAGDGS
jgi:predicted dehydrogenase